MSEEFNSTSDLGNVDEPKKSKGNGLKIGLAVVAVVLIAAIVVLAVNKDRVITYFTKDKIAEVYNKPVSINSYKTFFVVSALSFQANYQKEIWNQTLSNGKSAVDAAETASMSFVTENKLKVIKAEKEGVSLTAKEKKSAQKKAAETLKEFKAYHKSNFTAVLKKINFKEADFDKEFKGFFVDDALVQKLQSKLLKDYKTPLVRAEHILITIKSATFADGKHTDAQAKQIATNVLKQIKAKNGKNFEALAKQYSEDSSKTSGGDLGYFEKGSMVKAFANAAFSLKPGKISGLVKTEYGYHIIKVLAHGTAGQFKLTEAQKSQIENQDSYGKYAQKEFAKWKKEANIKEIKSKMDIVKKTSSTKTTKESSKKNKK